MTDEKLNETFFQDSREFLDTFAETLDEISRAAGRKAGGADGEGAVPSSAAPRDALDKGFRTIHSLKSEAAYLGFEKIAARSHEIETLLQGLREGKDLRHALEDMSRGLEELRNEIDKLRRRAGQSGINGSAEGEISADPAPRIRFTEFELSLLSEARERGERFYRVLCRIEEAETMVYPRLFLLISNLELEANVVRTVPELSDVTADVREIEIFLTAALEKEKLYRIVNIDQIARVQVTELDYPSVITEGELVSAMGSNRDQGFGRRNYLTVDTDKLEELKNGLEEIELLTGRLEGETDIAVRLGRLAAHCTDVVRRLRLRRLTEELLRIKRFGEELAGRQGKKVDFEISGGDFEVESVFLDHISEILIHLVRNAVDHGIEPPGEREASGKGKTGSVLITAEKKENSLTLQIADDGRGIDRESMIRRAREAGILEEGKPVPETLELLAAPGFTTLSEATDSSGRGYGLDLVLRKIREIPGAEIRMTGGTGSGTVFTLVFQHGIGITRLVFLRSGEKTVAVAKNQISEILEFDPVEAVAGGDNTLLFRGLPVYTADGRLIMRGSAPEEEFAVVLKHLDRQGVLLADEVLFERDVEDTRLGPASASIPHLEPLEIRSIDREVYMVRPSLLFK